MIRARLDGIQRVTIIAHMLPRFGARRVRVVGGEGGVWFVYAEQI